MSMLSSPAAQDGQQGKHGAAGLTQQIPLCPRNQQIKIETLQQLLPTTNKTNAGIHKITQ